MNISLASGQSVIGINGESEVEADDVREPDSGHVVQVNIKPMRMKISWRCGTGGRFSSVSEVPATCIHCVIKYYPVGQDKPSDMFLFFVIQFNSNLILGLKASPLEKLKC